MIKEFLSEDVVNFMDDVRCFWETHTRTRPRLGLLYGPNRLQI